MLFTTTAEIRPYLPTLVNSFDFADLESMLRMHEDTDIVYILGRTLYDELKQAYEDDTLTPVQTRLLDVVRRPLANLAAYSAIPLLNVALSNGGITVSTSSTQTPASQYRIEELRASLRNLASATMNEAIRFLQDNDAEYTAWHDGEAYIDERRYFIASATQFSQFYNISNNRWLFSRLTPIMARVEQELIKPVTGDAFYDKIKQEIEDGSVSPHVAFILDSFIRPAVASSTVFQGIDQLAISIDKYGVSVLTTGTTSSQTINLRNPAPESRIAPLQYRLKENSDLKVKQLATYLNANAAQFPEYENSPAYRPAESDVFQNETGKGYYFS